MFKSTTIIKYLEDVDEVYAFVDKQLVLYYRALVPKYIPLNKQRYDPHISVVRKEIIIDKTNWNKYNNKEVEFEYTNDIGNNDLYYWINVKCDFLCEIRQSLNLSRTTPWENKFHITIGNVKDIP